MVALPIAVLVLGIGIWCSIISYRRTRDLLHPSVLGTVFFVGPAAWTSLRWSALQAETWHWETEFLVISAVICFVWIPTILSPRTKIRAYDASEKKEWHALAVTIARMGTIACLVLFVLENYLASGYVIPGRALLTDMDVHTVSYSGLLWVTRNTATFAVLATALWIQRRKLIDFALMVACVLAQLTRLGRIDVWMASLAVAITIYYRFPQGRTRQAILRVGVACAVVGIVALAALTNYRMSRAYTYDLTYQSVISYTGPRDATGLLPFLYGYFSLSFENLNRLVSGWRGAHTWPMFTFEPVWGLLHFQNLFGYDLNITSLFEPVSGAANVPTGLAEFYVDAGLLAFLPMAFYGYVWAKLYARKERSLAWTGVYAVFTGACSLIGFQALILSAPLYAGMALVYGIGRLRQDAGSPAQGPARL